jgi:predicted translin family RNA/ssDNA-binding protein
MKNLLKQSLASLGAYKASASQLKKISDDIRVTAKNAIALVRRGSIDAAEPAMKTAEKLLHDAAELITKEPGLGWEGFYAEAVEEYVEAKAFCAALTAKAIEFPKSIHIDPEHVIGGIADATGELVRKAITDAFSEPITRIEEYRELVREAVESLSAQSLSGKLRGKYDEAERNLKKLEEVIYDLRLREKK